MHSCAERGGYSDVAKLLLQAGADPNIADNWGKTPLAWAKLNDYKDIVNLLGNAGAR